MQEREEELGKKAEAIGPFGKSGHGRVNYACGHVYVQCRCPENHGVTSTLPNACPGCAGPPKFPQVPTAPPPSSDGLVERIREIERDARLGTKVRDHVEWADRHRALMGTDADRLAMEEIRACVDLWKEEQLREATR